ncbi:MAG: FkbM family methyltransferase [Pseudomonadota bacterium]
MSQAAKNSEDFPRLFLIDHTRIGDGTATGEIKSNLLKTWPQDRVMQLYSIRHDTFGIYGATTSSRQFSSGKLRSPGDVWKEICIFNPDIILYRPVPHTEQFHDLAKIIIDETELPLALWVMDDWPGAHATSSAPAIERLKKDWLNLVDKADCRLSISSAMSEAFRQRYGKEFIAVANGVDPHEWPKAQRTTSSIATVRYAGSLAENMTLASLLLVSQAVESLAKQGCNIRFEIKTRKFWGKQAKRHFREFEKTSIITRDLSPQRYREWLSSSDIVVIAYNFDAPSKTYTRYSLANKLSECLASGSPLIAIGPDDVATLSMLDEVDCGVRINSPDTSAIEKALRALIESPEIRLELAQKGQSIAFEKMNISEKRKALRQALSKAGTRPIAEPISLPRSAHAEVDESAVIYELLKNRRGIQNIMLDIGSHFGASAMPFQKLGWKIQCFEPDSQNRETLTKQIGAFSNVTIDARALSDVAQPGAPFFRSNQSTGISSLQPFHNTHLEAAQVEVTTLSNVVQEQQYSEVTFLKIDVEGLDFAVLKGAPWQLLQPEVIECEFEDSKIQDSKHNWKDIAEFLAEKGYTVYVSEWHPILQYGQAHDWRRLFRYPENKVANQAWGNLLAFQNDPGEEVLRATVSRLLTFRTKANDPPWKIQQKNLWGVIGACRRLAASPRYTLTYTADRLTIALRRLKKSMK